MSSGCARDVRAVHRRRPDVYERYLEAIETLATDPYNRSGRADIRKLEKAPAGQGRYRLRVGDYRLRYDIEGGLVTLHSFLPRSVSYRD